MVFNSIDFLVFIALFFPVYFALKGKSRLWLCLLASYLFYGWWDYRFMGLIMASTLIDYFLGLRLEDSDDPKQRKTFLYISLFVNLGFLVFFKYFGFFADSLRDAFANIGYDPGWNTFNIILPVGISFYTFQSMSYTIDVYNKKIPVERSFLRFATFVSFFPQLVAGPIVRASEFLPQFQKDHPFSHQRFVLGLGQVLWGFFKKVAIADSLAPFVDQVFQDPTTFSSFHLLVGVIFYSFQIYCDFSGYSDIAIGLARMLGFDFPRNFRTPYFSQNFSEFWTRWHITLSSWLRDYLYIPLGGNREGSFGSIFWVVLFGVAAVGVTRWWWLMGIYAILAAGIYIYAKQGNKQAVNVFNYLNLMVTMLLGGLWHGASWAFVYWGFLHGMYLVFQRLLSSPWNSVLNGLRVPKFGQMLLNILIVYTLTCFAWIYFRSPTFEVATTVIDGITSGEGFHPNTLVNKFVALKGMILIGLLLIFEIANFKFDFYDLVVKQPVWRVVSFTTLLLLIAFFGTFGANAFIYFQF